MSSVDDRIVNMKFNNQQFTQGVDKSKRDLTGLESALTKAGRNKGLTDIGNQATQVGGKFSAMQIAGVAAIGTIASKATIMAGNFLKGFTIQPLIDGFKEYQTNLESVQTIMANTGKSVKTVNGYLNELNTYSDQTIYNFSEMARNIGTFTAAGVKLPTATSAIKGIANLAAFSGSSSQQASTAMYQLSQAIAAGRVNLQDWNSVVNAGMGGKAFQSALARTAVAMGEIDESAVKVGDRVTVAGESFRESIGGGDSWLNSDILVNTLATLDGRFSRTALAMEGFTKKKQQDNQIEKARQELAKKGVKLTDAQLKDVLKMSDAAFNAATQIKTFPQLIDVLKESMGSMWANAFSLIIGDFKQSKKLWTSVGDAITGKNGVMTKMSSSFLSTLRLWRKKGGRQDILQGLKNVFLGLGSVLETIKIAFQNVFPPNAAGMLKKISKQFRNFSEGLRPSEDVLRGLTGIFGAFFSIIKLGLTVLGAVGGAIGALFGKIFKASEGSRGGILLFVGSIGEMVTAFEQWLTTGGKLVEWSSKFGSVVGSAVAPLLSAVSMIVRAIGLLASGQGLDAAMVPFDSAKEKLKEFISGLLGMLATITGPFDKVSQWFLDMKSKIDGARKSVEDIANPIAHLDEKIKNFSVNDQIDKGLGKMGTSIDEVKSKSKGMYDDMKGASAKAAADSQTMVGSAATDSASRIDSLKDMLGKAWDAVKGVFGKIGEAFSWIGGHIRDLFTGFDSMDWVGLFNGIFTGAMILTIRRFFGSLEGFVETIKNSFEGFGKSATGAFDQLTDTLKSMQREVQAKLILAIAIAVGILVASLIALSYIPMEKLAVGLGAIGAMIAMLVFSMKALDSIGKTVDENGDTIYNLNLNLVALAGALLILATSMLVMAAAVAIFGNMDTETLLKGFTSIAVGLVLMVGALFLLSKMEGSIEGAAGSILVISIAMNVLAAAVLAFGSMDTDTLLKGFTSIAVGLALMVGALYGLSKMEGSIEGAAGSILVVSMAMVVLAGAVAIFGNMDTETLVKGMVSIGVGLAMMVGALKVLSMNEGGTLAGAAAIALVAASLYALTAVVAIFGNMSWETLLKGFAAMAVGLGLIVGAAYLAMAVIPGLFALAVVIDAIGRALLFAGLGMLAFGAGFALFAAAGVAGVAILVLAFNAFIAMLPSLATQLAASFVAFLKVIANAMPKIRAAMKKIITNILGIVRDAIPEVGKLFEELILEAIRIIVSLVPEIVDAALTLIEGFLDALNERIPGIIDSAVTLIETFLKELGLAAGRIADAGAQLIIDVIQGLERAVKRRGQEIRDAAKSLANTFVDELKKTLKELIEGMDLPSIPMPKIPGVGALGRALGMGKGKGFAADGSESFGRGMQGIQRPLDAMLKAIEKAGVKVAKALETAVQLLTGKSYEGAAGTYARQSTVAQGQAYRYAEQANLRDKTATRSEAKAEAAMAKAEKIKDAEKRKKAKKAARNQAKAAAKQRKQAEALAKRAEKAQELADYKEQQAQDEMAFDQADNQGKGDIRSQQGQDLADRAQAMLERANAKAKEAEKLSKGDAKERARAKKLREQAKKDAEAASKLAKQANDKQREALALYEDARQDAQKTVEERIRQIEDELAAVEEAKAAEKELEDAETAQDKADILNKRAEENEKKAAEARAEYERLIKLAEEAAKVDPELAMGILDEAEAQVDLAQELANRAEQERDQAEQALDQGNNSGGGSGPDPADITPSRTALEDAAKAVDRYTDSLRQAEELANATPGVVQYTQNNYSPKALSATEIYRQNKNLLSAHEIKMAGT